MTKKKKEKLKLSYSRVSTFLDCKKKYYWKYVVGIELNRFNQNFIIGNSVHHGVYKLYEGAKNPVLSTKKYFNKERNQLRKDLLVNAKDEQILNEKEPVVLGMIEGYGRVYKKQLKKIKHISNEHHIEYEIEDGIVVTMFFDNILKVGKKLFVHELKTARTLTPDYVNNIKNDLQSNMYFYLGNRSQGKKKKWLSGIVYDVIKKPSIRMKKTEDKKQFLARLGRYYSGPEAANELFYQDYIEKPMVKESRILETVLGVADDLLKCIKDSTFYPNDCFCYVRSRCDYYDICHYGENAETLSRYKKRKKKKGEK